jgi:ribosomal protein L16 Arg81 hydroxylase
VSEATRYHWSDLLPDDLSLDDFVARYWGKQVLYLPQALSRLPSIDLSEGRLWERLEGLELEPDALEVQGPGGGKDKSLPEARAAYALGGTLAFNHPEWHFPELRDLVVGMKFSLGEPGSVTGQLWASPTGHGTGIHFDSKQVLAIQLHGRKRWRVSPVPYATYPPVNMTATEFGETAAEQVRNYTARFPWTQVRDHEEGLVEYTLEPGDVLFVPAGCWHAPVAEAASVHLSLFCTPETPEPFFQDLLHDSLGELPLEWRAPLPPLPTLDGRSDLEPVRSYFEARLAEYKAWLDTITPERLCERWGRLVHKTPHRFEAEPPERPSLEKGDVLRVPPRAILDVIDCGEPGREGKVSVWFEEEEAVLPAALRPLLEEVRRRKTFRAEEATTFCGEGVEVPWDTVRVVLALLAFKGMLLLERPPAE